ncbi:hypothetical protein ACQP2T_00325 [Nonomuraea sp. CA-143628]|uniref:hypothetical protein n=1 Tax=Nonomuraea sp. CA-143628 TaxID=3239997 RepID=UPI003D8A8586
MSHRGLTGTLRDRVPRIAEEFKKTLQQRAKSCACRRPGTGLQAARPGGRQATGRCTAARRE